MTFFFLGLIIFTYAFSLRLRFKRENDEEGVSGMNAWILAGLILTILYGTIYRLAII